MDKCFAESNDRCRALKIKDCGGCRFYKTKEEAEQSKKKALDRIMSLDEEVRRNIIDTYYNGKVE